MTDNTENKLTPEQLVQKDIDADKGLASKRKLLTVASLILMALAFSGAKVEEANTFLVKLSFDNQEGIPLLLATSIVFLMLRYYNYAQPYHERLYRIWTKRMLGMPPFYYSDDPFDGVEGDISALRLKTRIDPDVEWSKISMRFSCKLIYRRYVRFEWWDGYGDHREDVDVNFRKYWKYELKYQFESLSKHRENLDIIAPYIVGVVALLSYGYRWVYLT